MDVMTYTDARAKLKDVMDRVTEDQDEIVISRSKGASVVMVSLDSWNAQQETNYLLSTPENAAALRESIAEMEANGGEIKELL
mgnify:CR=1 FL=1